MLEHRNETRVEKETPRAKATRRIKHVGKFGAVGALNTLLDFVIYNVLSGNVGLSLIESNIISTTVAMTFSFFANKQLVFKKHDGVVAKQAISFLVITAFGLYILQNGTIQFLTQVWHYPMLVMLDIAHIVGVRGHDDFLVKNGAKAIATVISLSWNYVMYKKVVFK